MSAASGAGAGKPIVVLLGGDETTRATFSGDLARDHRVVLAADEAEARQALASPEGGLLVVDDAGGGDGAHAIRRRLVEAGVTAPMVIMTARGDEHAAVEALRVGFTDFVLKRDGQPSADILRTRIATSLEIARLKGENERLQQAIEESQARLFNVYDSLDDAIMQVDHECRVVSVNRSAAALANCEPRDAVGKVCHELFDFSPCEKRAKKADCHIYQTFFEDETQRGTRDDPATKSSYQWMTFITTFKDEDYVVYRETDVTEKRELEARIARAIESLGVAPPKEGATD